MSDDKPKTTQGEPEPTPAPIATIYHPSADRPDGQATDDIAELGRLANRGRRNTPRKLTLLRIAAVSIGVMAVGVAATPWALIAMDKLKAARTERASVSSLSAVANNIPYDQVPSPTVPDVPAPAHMEVKGLYIGQYREEVTPAVTARGWMVGPDNSPLMEMHFGLPKHEAAESLYIDDAACREGLDHQANMTPEEADSIAGMRLTGCELA